jgi:hypothetical protein
MWNESFINMKMYDASAMIDSEYTLSTQVLFQHVYVALILQTYGVLVNFIHIRASYLTRKTVIVAVVVVECDVG